MAMNKSHLLGTMFFCVLTLIVVAPATAFTYSETVDGDISGSVEFALDTGLNTINGSTSFDTDGATDWDDFLFSVPVGSTVDSIVYSFTNTNFTGDLTYLGVNPSLYIDVSGDLQFLGYNGYIDLFSSSSPVSLFTSLMPLSQSRYELSEAIAWYTAEHGAASWDYTKSIYISAIPVPATVWLFGSGLIGLVGIARRRKA